MWESWKAVRDEWVVGVEEGGGVGREVKGTARTNSNSTPKVREWGGEEVALRVGRSLVIGNGDGDEVAGWN